MASVALYRYNRSMRENLEESKGAEEREKVLDRNERGRWTTGAIAVSYKFFFFSYF
jgi:hypothetical protein